MVVGWEFPVGDTVLHLIQHILCDGSTAVLLGDVMAVHVEVVPISHDYLVAVILCAAHHIIFTIQVHTCSMNANV